MTAYGVQDNLEATAGEQGKPEATHMLLLWLLQKGKTEGCQDRREDEDKEGRKITIPASFTTLLLRVRSAGRTAAQSDNP